MVVLVRRIWNGWWTERLAALLAVAGVTIAVAGGLQVRGWQASASDFKTLYASVWCLVHGVNAYSFLNIEGVFAGNDVVRPVSWYAHAPVYPPFTLALMSPLTVLSMVAASYVWVVLSAMVLACAAFALARAAWDAYDLGRGWRLAIIAAVAASPLVSFGLEMGNVSVMSAALCLLVVTAGGTTSVWLCALELAVALLLKPHLAFWVFAGLLFLPGRRGRKIALLATMLCGIFAAGTWLWLAAQHQAVAQITSYHTMVNTELGAGSMDIANHELIGVPAQITSLSSLLGFWLGNTALVHVSVLVFVILCSALLISRSRRISRWNPHAETLFIMACWCTLGLLATYHRAHDAIVLLLLAPWWMARLRRSLFDAAAWCFIALYLLMSVDPVSGAYAWLGSKTCMYHLSQVLTYRQAPLALAMLAALIFTSAVFPAEQLVLAESEKVLTT